MSNTHNSICPICNKRLEYLAKVTDSRSVYKCRNCALRRLLPLPAPKTISQLYGRKEYYTDDLAELHNDLTINYKESSPIVKLFKRQLKAIEDIAPPPRSIFEIGCARGVFLDLARKKGYKVSGIEINPYAYKYAREKFKLNIKLTSIENLKVNKSSYDIVIAFDVIEHIKEPLTLLKKMSDLLKPGGLAVIGTPNSSSWLNIFSEAVGRFGISYPLYRFYGRGVEHLSIFNEDNLKLLSKKAGLIPVSTYGYSVPASHITRVPLFVKPFISVLVSPPYEFIQIAIKANSK